MKHLQKSKLITFGIVRRELKSIMFFWPNRETNTFVIKLLRPSKAVDVSAMIVNILRERQVMDNVLVIGCNSTT